MATFVKRSLCPDFVQFDKNGDPVETPYSLRMLAEKCREMNMPQMAEIYLAKAANLEVAE